MKKHINIAGRRYDSMIYTIILFTGLLSCRVQKISSNKDQQQSLVIQGPLWGALWQQKAAEYKALCYQAYNIAGLRLDVILQQPHTKPIAIVTDIDETVLDNSPYQVHQAFRNLGYSDASWMEWTARTECDTFRRFIIFKICFIQRGAGIFITNRLEAERNPTLKNLQRWNFPDATGDHLFLKQTVPGKEQRRSVVAQNHEIVLLLGDNLSDFSAVFDKQPFEKRDAAVTSNASSFGARFIVLPNAAYGDWEAALYNFDYKLTPAQKDSVIKLQLRTY